MNKFRIIEVEYESWEKSYFIENEIEKDVWIFAVPTEYYTFNEALRNLRKMKQAVTSSNVVYVDED